MGFWDWVTGRGKKRIEEARRKQDAEKLRRQGWYETDRDRSARRQQADKADDAGFQALMELDAEEKQAEKARHEWTQWYDLNSSNLDRTRYLAADEKAQIVYKDGSCYEYAGVTDSPDETL